MSHKKVTFWSLGIQIWTLSDLWTPEIEIWAQNIVLLKAAFGTFAIWNGHCGKGPVVDGGGEGSGGGCSAVTNGNIICLTPRGITDCTLGVNSRSARLGLAHGCSWLRGSSASMGDLLSPFHDYSTLIAPLELKMSLKWFGDFLSLPVYFFLLLAVLAEAL